MSALSFVVVDFTLKLFLLYRYKLHFASLFRVSKMYFSSCMGAIRGGFSHLVGIRKERNHQEELSVDESVILQMIFENWDREG